MNAFLHDVELVANLVSCPPWGSGSFLYSVMVETPQLYSLGRGGGFWEPRELSLGDRATSFLPVSNGWGEGLPPSCQSH